MAACEVGPPCSLAWEAWARALDHRLANCGIEMHRGAPASSSLEPFEHATLPPEALDVHAMAARYGLSETTAASQIERLRGQAIYMNDRYQVNVEIERAPFGEGTSDVAWLSIKRRDRAPVHDWRELQQIKNMIVGEAHEGFELYPAESRLVDTANQYHLWVFMDPGVRLPVGYRSREVLGAADAAAVGAGQRDFDAQR